VVEKNQGGLSSAADAESVDDIEGDSEVGSSRDLAPATILSYPIVKTRKK
jgi:hypothetical protein